MNYIFLILNVIAWAIAPILIKWLSRYFDVHTQNFYRYLGASIFLFIVARSIYPVPWSKAVKKLKIFLLPAICIVATQILWVSGIYLSKAALAVLLGKLHLLFIILFSYLIFHDEREVVRSPRFKIAVILILIGVTGAILGRDEIMSLEIGWGIVLIVLSCITWAFYSIAVKITTVKVTPLVSSSLAIAIATIFLLPAGLSCGNLNQLSEAPFLAIVVLFGSGILGVGIGQALFYRNIKNVGTVITTSFILSTPIISLVFAYFILGEKLTLLQILAGAFILAGCYIMLPLTKKVPVHRNI